MACSLADAFLRTFYAPTQRRQVEIALDFARGMAYLHSRRQPIVHRCVNATISNLLQLGPVLAGVCFALFACAAVYKLQLQT